MSIAPNWRKGGAPMTLEEYLRDDTPAPKAPERGTREHFTPRAHFDWREWTRCAAEKKPLSFFFPEDGASPALTAAIRLYCSKCPVADECLQHAVDGYIREGWYGGKSPKERRKLAPGSRLRRHGTDVMYRYGPVGMDSKNGCRCGVCLDHRRVRLDVENEARRVNRQAKL